MKKQTVITVCTLFVILGFTACFCVSHVKNSLKSTLNCARSKEKLIQGFISVGETPEITWEKRKDNDTINSLYSGTGHIQVITATNDTLNAEFGLILDGCMKWQYFLEHRNIYPEWKDKKVSVEGLYLSDSIVLITNAWVN